MRRGPKPAKPKEAKRPVGRKSPKADARVRDLEKRLAEALRDKATAQEQLQTRDSDLLKAFEQQTATSVVLRIIASSPTDVRPVFDTVAESAARLCDATDAAIWRREDDRLLLAAHHGPIPVRSTVPLIREEVTGRAVLDGRAVHVADLQSETVEFPRGSENARRLGLRTV